MLMQMTPVTSHRRHRYAYASGDVPVQGPVVVVSVPPCWGRPETEGRDLLAGGAAVTIAVGSDSRSAVPAALRALTRTRIAAPMSSTLSRWLAPSAPGMSAQC